MHAVGTVSDLDGAAWTIVEDDGPNLIMIVGLDLPDIVVLETR